MGSQCHLQCSSPGFEAALPSCLTGVTGAVWRRTRLQGYQATKLAWGSHALSGVLCTLSAESSGSSMNVTSNWLEENKEEMSKRIRKEQNESCSTSVVLLMPGHRYLQTEDQQLELRRNLNVPDHAGLHELFLCSSFFFLHTLGAAMGCYGMLWVFSATQKPLKKNAFVRLIWISFASGTSLDSSETRSKSSSVPPSTSLRWSWNIQML